MRKKALSEYTGYMSRVKLIDVANRAGVSKSTVSQFLNGRYEYMSADTKEKIDKAVKELGYVPNPIARSLKTRKTFTIGVIVDDMTGSTTSKIIRGIDDYCKKLNYNILIYNTDHIPENEERSIEILKTFGVDGMIISSTGENIDLINKTDQDGIPIIHINRSYEGLEVNTVLSDFYNGSRDAIKHILDLGHRDIGLLTRPYKEIPSRKRRVDGCLDPLKDFNISIDEEHMFIIENYDEVKNAYDQLMSLPKPPTVIFSQYSRITIELLTHMNSLGVNIPEDISVIAFDDLPLSHLFKTPLTVVNQKAYELGTESASLLLKKIKNPKDIYEDIIIPCELIVRDSCK